MSACMPLMNISDLEDLNVTAGMSARHTCSLGNQGRFILLHQHCHAELYPRLSSVTDAILHPCFHYDVICKSVKVGSLPGNIRTSSLPSPLHLNFADVLMEKYETGFLSFSDL